MGGSTFFIKAEDVMNPESWSPEDFVTLPMCCPESLLVPFAGGLGGGAAHFPASLAAFVFLEL